MKMNLFFKQLFVSGVLFVAAMHSNAQSFNITWGDKTKLRYDFDDALKLPDGNTMILKLTATTPLQIKMFGSKINSDVTPAILMVDKNMETLKEKIFL